MVRPLLPLLLVFSLTTLHAPSTAEGQRRAHDLIARADSLAVFGDTARALAALDSVVRRYPKNAVAWNRLGMLAWAKVRPNRKLAFMRKQADIHLLRQADSSLRLARFYAPDSGRYALDLGRFFLFADFVTLRAQAPGLFEKALNAARRTRDSILISEAADELGMRQWRRYEAMADRRLLRGVDVAHLEPLITSQSGARNFLDNFTTPVPGHAGQADYLKASDLFATALAADPNNPHAVRHRFMALAAQSRWEELLAATELRLSAGPFDPQAWLARGLALHRLGRDDDSQAAFDSGLSLLSTRDRDRYNNLSRILRAADSSAYLGMSATERAELERVYWTVSDPLSLTPSNEHRLEFLSRVTFSELLWTSDDLDLLGADTDRGQIWVRYGPPPVIASFAPSEGAGRSCVQISEGRLDCGGLAQAGVGTILWYYPATNLHFVFRAPPSYGVASFAGDYAQVAREARYKAPVAWTNLPTSTDTDSVLVQLARFRPGAGAASSADSVDLAVYADVPIRRMIRNVDIASGPMDVAFTAYDARARRIARDSSREMIQFKRPDPAERRAWRRRFHTGNLFYRVEAHQPDALRGARASGRITLQAERGFGMSDVVVGDRIMPRDSTPQRWTDFTVTPSAGLLRQGQSFGLMWETYDLPTRDGLSRYKVEIVLKVTEVARPSGIVARIIGGTADAVGLSAKGDEQVALSYVRQRDSRPVVTDHVTLELGSAPPGKYRLTLRITDLPSGRSVARDRELTVIE